jgi:hypothetical protein
MVAASDMPSGKSLAKARHGRSKDAICDGVKLETNFRLMHPQIIWKRFGA